MLVFIENIIAFVINVLIDVLPQSPFSSMTFTTQATWLSWLNWFIPVGGFLVLGASWLLAVAGYYAWSTLMAWLHLGNEG